MDYGYLTDNTGQKADFRHVIIIMTSNAGALQLERGVIGFTNQSQEQVSLSTIKHYFSPEFRNRLDAVIPFNYLDKTIILKVVDKFIRELREQLKGKGVQLSLSLKAKKWLAERGYDEKMGARPMARLIQEKLKMPLADQLLSDELHSGDKISIDVKDGDVVIQRAERLITQL